MAIRMSGMISGMDTEALVSAMVSTYVERKQKYQKAQTKLEWKQDAYKSINTKVYSLYSKVSNLRFSSAYNMKKTTVSDSTKASVIASGTAINGTQSLQISQLAKSGYLTGAQFKSGTTENSTLADLGYTGADTTITVRVGDSAKDIAVTKDTTISELVSKLNESGVKANYDGANQRIFVSSTATGTANDFSLTASDMSGLQALAAAGLSVASEANTEVYKANAAYAIGTMGVDGNGNVVNYFELDGDGNIVYDKDGKAKVNSGVTYSASETQKAILAILKQVKTARDENADLALEKTALEKKISYSVAKDAVNQYIAEQDEDKRADAKQLINLLKEDSSKYKYVNADGEVVTDYEGGAGMVSLEDKIKELAKGTGLITTSTNEDGEEKEDSTALDALKANVQTVIAVDDNAVYTKDDKKAYYLTEDERTALQAEDGRLAKIAAQTAVNNAILADPKNSYWDVKNYTDVDLDKLASEITDKITTAKEIVEGNLSIPISKGATRVDAQDAKIILNDAEFTSDSNTFNINGLTIKALAETKEGEDLTISTDTDSQGMYDKIKDFLTEYNSLINELSTLYNAESASKYEPLTDEEKEAMSDSEIEKWETKIKDSILRRDSTIGGVITAMNTAMTKSYEVNGKSYSLGSFGIQTLGYLNAAKNENYAFHIDGDSEDDVSSGKTDKLLSMITNEPEVVEDFMKQLTSGLYTALDEKMKSSSLSSAYTIYNDKQMTKEYNNYKTLIKTWEEKIADMEDRYYKQFSNMESQLAKLQSSTSSLSSLLGNS